MATVTRYLDSSATGAANGTSWADAYTTWAAWNTAEATNLVSAGDSHVLKVRGNIHTLTAILSLTGWTTGASNTLTIEADAADRHQGVYSASKPGIIMAGSSADAGTLSINNPCGHVVIRGLQFRQAVTYSGAAVSRNIAFGWSNTGNTLTIENCLFISVSSTATGQFGIRYDASSLTLRVKNCVFINYDQSSSQGIGNAGTNPTAYIYNNTFRNCTTALSCSGNARLKNNVFSSNTADVNGTPHSTTNYNLTNQASFPVGANNVTSTSLTFRDSGANDYHLAAGDTAAIGAGIGPSSDGEVPTTDVDGDTRSGTTTDIGFDVYVSASSGLSITSVTPSYSLASSKVIGTGLSAGQTLTYKGVACTSISASSSLTLTCVFPNFYTNNIKLGAVHEFKVVD